MSDATILRRLSAMLDAQNPRLASFLYRFWTDEQQAVTYKELRESILSGQLSIEHLFQWQQDYSMFIAEHYAKFAQAAIETAAKDLLKEYGGLLRDPHIPAMEQFISTRGAELVREITSGQYRAINTLVRQATMSSTLSVDDLARAIRPCVGLTERQSQTTYKYYERLREQGYNHKDALNRQATYAAKIHRRRAATIAQTEMAHAYNAGAAAVIQGHINGGKISPKTTKRWVTAADERVCEICGALEGITVPIDAPFPVIGKQQAPAHPLCRCAVAYEIPGPQPIATPDTEPEGMTWEEFDF